MSEQPAESQAPTSAPLATSAPSAPPSVPSSAPSAPLSTPHPSNSSSQSAPIGSSLPLPAPPENPGNTVPAKTLWMGDIEAWWDEDSIVEIWAKLGLGVMVKVIKPKKNLILRQLAKNHGQPMLNHSGYCFVEFETSDQAKEALALNGTPIPGAGNKLFRLNWATAATLNSQIEQTPEYSLFVGDLSPGTTEAHLLALFQTHFNTVKTVRVMTDPATGLSRCFGFVRFSSEDDRNRALIEMNGKWLGGRPIRVALATPKHQSSGYRTKTVGLSNLAGMTAIGAMGGLTPMDLEQQSIYMSAPLAGPPPPMGYYGPLPPQSYTGTPLSASDSVGSPTPPPSILQGAVLAPQGSQGSQGSQGQQGPSGFADPSNTTVFVGGLASGIAEDTLRTLFEPFGQIIHVRVPPGKGCGFVKFEDRESAEQAVAGMQGFVIGGSRIRLSWGRSSGRSQQRQNQPFQQGQQVPQGLQAPQMSQSQAQMMMAAAASAAAAAGSGPFEYGGGIPQQLGPPPSAGASSPGVEMFTGPGPHGSQGTPAGLVGVPPGAQMFYDPYFAAALQQQQQQQQQAQQQAHQDINDSRDSLGLQQEESQQNNPPMQQQQLNPSEPAFPVSSVPAIVPSPPIGVIPGDSAMTGIPGMMGSPGLRMDTADGMPPIPQQFFDQAGQYMYMAQPFPNSMVQLMGAEDADSAVYGSADENGSMAEPDDPAKTADSTNN
ncbi:DEKNAAC105120 [Brettanomyces naardenensis]|uniref:DEKNAAC105120 n=1 Tax=Brettanomyces naardenensis TaxID=13370 RepID=A0A448YSP6_BRENA|nr:DEKNAAC105120 [Brettanomyces naardenensis]